MTSAPERRWSRAKPTSDDVFARELAQLIRKARVHCGMTQAELAGWMRIRKEAVARIEASDTLPSVRTLLRVADAVGCRLEICFVNVGHVRNP